MASTKVDVPFTNDKVDPTDPAGAAKSVGFLIIGFTILMFAFLFGADFGRNLQNSVANAIGLETSGNDGGLEVV